MSRHVVEVIRCDNCGSNNFTGGEEASEQFTDHSFTLDKDAYTVDLCSNCARVWDDLTVGAIISIGTKEKRATPSKPKSKGGNSKGPKDYSAWLDGEGDEMYCCDLCESMFQNGRGLSMHYTQKHNEPLPDVPTVGVNLRRIK